ncbi:hypothetical protein [Streptomyces sp. I05A-00742]|uniref:hypothetical protein n=1 Tax=Streptomyces sp. I05A-00742 TaxID=2732853 RepID=UPI0014899A0B|nr:hypothetical protein [Streptomyces sp. I05A-00742]
MTVADWASSVERAWDKEPVVLPAPSPLDPHEVFPLLVDRADPFRAGTRIDSRSPVRFRTTRGRLAAPGGLLPTAEDTDLDSYANRLHKAGAAPGWLLTVDNPFEHSFAAWSRLRDRMSELWRRIGWPSVPVAVELAMGHAYERPPVPEPDHAVFTWVLRGRLHAWTDGSDTAAGGDELHAGAGDFIYWPAGRRVAETYADRCALLRVLVPSDPRAAFTVVRDAVRNAVRPGESAHPLPYLPFPCGSASGRSGSVATPTAAPILEIADAVGRALTAPEFARSLRHGWAARRSAAGLEPVPAPGPVSDLDYGQRFRVTAEIVTMPDGPADAVWAVNGHLLPVGGAAAARVLAALPPGGETEASEVCRSTGAGARHDGVLRLLRSLHRLRGIEVLEGSRA